MRLAATAALATLAVLLGIPSAARGQIDISERVTLDPPRTIGPPSPSTDAVAEPNDLVPEAKGPMSGRVPIAGAIDTVNDTDRFLLGVKPGKRISFDWAPGPCPKPLAWSLKRYDTADKPDSGTPTDITQPGPFVWTTPSHQRTWQPIAQPPQRFIITINEPPNVGAFEHYDPDLVGCSYTMTVGPPENLEPGLFNVVKERQAAEQAKATRLQRNIRYRGTLTASDRDTYSTRVRSGHYVSVEYGNTAGCAPRASYSEQPRPYASVQTSMDGGRLISEHLPSQAHITRSFQNISYSTETLLIRLIERSGVGSCEYDLLVRSATARHRPACRHQQRSELPSRLMWPNRQARICPVK